MLGRLLGAFGRRRPTGPPPTVGPGVRVYGIGDIHGRADLLGELHDLIAADAASAPAQRRVVVYLGDYVDRGLQSRQVIDLLIGAPLPGFERVFLRGNHEDALLRVLDQGDAVVPWLQVGGDATLFSYGVRFQGIRDPATDAPALQARLGAALPEAHLAFLRGLELTHREGDYLFVHAGVRPGVPLEQQEPRDLLWIRSEFLKHRGDFGAMIVHGHSISLKVEERDNRIGIDTGAYATGVLTALVLEGDQRRFLQTKIAEM